MDQFYYDGRIIRASYGTTKFCSYFLKSKHCTNKNCLYLHSYGNQEDIIEKTQIAQKTFAINQEKMALRLTGALEKTQEQFIATLGNRSPANSEFPSPESLYTKPLHTLANTTLNAYHNLKARKTKPTLQPSISRNRSKAGNSATTETRATKEERMNAPKGMTRKESRFSFASLSPREEEQPIVIPAQVQSFIETAVQGLTEKEGIKRAKSTNSLRSHSCRKEAELEDILQENWDRDIFVTPPTKRDPAERLELSALKTNEQFEERMGKAKPLLLLHPCNQSIWARRKQPTREKSNEKLLEEIIERKLRGF